MPKLDGTGSAKQGSGKGRKLGNCSQTPDEEKIKRLEKHAVKQEKVNA